MTDLALDPSTSDLVIEGGDLVLIRGADAIAQDANLRVALFKGEWPLDLRVGIDYQNLFFGRRPPDAVVRAVYDQVLRETAGVKQIERLQIRFDSATRTLNVTAVVLAQDDSIVPIYKDIILDERLAALVNPPSDDSPSPTPTLKGAV